MHTAPVLGISEVMRALIAMLEEANKEQQRPLAFAIVDQHGDLLCYARMDRIGRPASKVGGAQGLHGCAHGRFHQDLGRGTEKSGHGRRRRRRPDAQRLSRRIARHGGRRHLRWRHRRQRASRRGGRGDSRDRAEGHQGRRLAEEGFLADISWQVYAVVND